MSDINPSAALTYFEAHDQVMAKLLKTAITAPIPIPQAKSPEQYFSSIVTSIISQQISTKAAAAVRDRFIEQVGNEITPNSVLAQSFDSLKACGLSNQKTKYIKHNAEVWESIPYKGFQNMDNEEIISELTKLYGIGRWTAEMFLMFSMARPDVFSYGDHGLMQGLYLAYNYHPHYVRKIKDTVEAWSPHRTMASLALWHFKDNGPVIH